MELSAAGVARLFLEIGKWMESRFKVADMPPFTFVLARTFHISLDRVTDPDAFAAWALANLAAGLIVSLSLRGAETIAARNTSFHVERCSAAPLLGRAAIPAADGLVVSEL